MAWNKNIVKNNEKCLNWKFFENFNLGKIVLEFSEKRLISNGEKLKFRVPRFKLHFSSPVHQTLKAAISKATFSGCTSWYKLRGLHPPLFWDFRNLNTRNQSKIKQPWALSLEPVYQACWDQSIFLVAARKHNFDKKASLKWPWDRSEKSTRSMSLPCIWSLLLTHFYHTKCPLRTARVFEDKISGGCCNERTATLFVHTSHTTSIQIKIFTLIM